MLSLSREMPEIGANWLRYCFAFMRATNREVTEFSDSCMIAAKIAAQAAKENPLTLWQMLEVMQHNQALMSKGVLSAQEKLTSFVFDQIE